MGRKESSQAAVSAGGAGAGLVSTASLNQVDG